MNNINSYLLNSVCNYLGIYDSNRKEIYDFINTNNFISRQQKAIRIIEEVMAAHSKRKILRSVSELARIEHAIKELDPWARDHVVHALLTYLLGIYLNELFLIPINRVKVNYFQWELSSLLHDVGYPVQMAKDSLLAPYTKTVNKIRRDLDAPTKDVTINIVPLGFEHLTNDVNSFDLIQRRLEDWDIKIDVRKEYEQMIFSGSVCHGIFSSLTVLNIIDLIYQKFNPKRVYEHIIVPGTGNISVHQEFFENDIVNACTAIFLHNLPSDHFRGSKIDRKKAPLAFLLKLADCLQEWERPSKENVTGFSAEKFSIEIVDKQVHFTADIPHENFNKIRDEISNTLLASDIILRRCT